MNKKMIWSITVPVVLFAILALCIHWGLTAKFENRAYSESVERMSPWLTHLMKTFTYIGNLEFIAAFCLLLFLMPKSKEKFALPVFAAVFCSTMLNIILKNIFSRERPNILRLINEFSYSFPSGHAMINASLYTMLILLICKFAKNTSQKIGLTALCALLCVFIGISRIYLGVHYAGDILGGWLLGFAVSMFIYYNWNNRLNIFKK